MKRYVLLAMLCSVSAWAEDDAIIWTSETTADAAASQLAKAKAGLGATGLKLSEGWPRVMTSDLINGLKPGFAVVMIGFCPTKAPRWTRSM